MNRPLKRIMLPVGLPTLRIAWLELPYPMTEGEWNQVVAVLGYCKEALIAGPEESVPVVVPEVSEVRE